MKAGKVFLWVAVLVLLPGLVFTAGKGEQPAAKAVKLQIWGIQTFNPKGDELIAQYVKEFAAVNKIEAEYVVVPANVLDEKLAAGFESGSPPDAWQQVGAKIQYYISNNLTIPLDDLVAEMKSKQGGIYENLFVQGKSQGKIWALPIEIDLTPMYARTDLLKAAGLGIPQTWEDLRKASIALNNPPAVYGLGLPIGLCNDAVADVEMAIWSFGGAMFGEDGKTVTFDSPETRAAYQFLADLVMKDKVIPQAALSWDDAGNNKAYQSRQAAFIINPPSVYQWMQENDKELLGNTKLINIPKGPGPKGQNGARVASWVWAVSKQGPNQEFAKKWLSYFFEVERYNKLIEVIGGRWFPIYRSLADMPFWKNNPDFSEFPKMAGSGILPGYKGPPTALASEVAVTYLAVKVLQKIVVDGMSVANAVSWGQDETKKIAAKY